jgi:hypothetical protein
MNTSAKLLLCALGVAAFAGTPAVAKDAKASRNTPVERVTVERMPAMVAEPGDKATAPVGPAFVGRAYWDAARIDFDRQMNRGY